jgi:hypothetical protein
MPTCGAEIDDSFAGPYLNVHCDTAGNTIGVDDPGPTTSVWIGNSYWSFNDTYGYTAINSSGGSSTVNVFRTTRAIDVFGGALMTVNLGLSASVQGIRNSVFIDDSTRNATVNVYDYADSSFRTTNITTGGSSSPYEDITGLAPGGIRLVAGAITTAYVDTGSGGATVNVQQTNVNTYLIGNSSNTTVNVGS